MSTTAVDRIDTVLGVLADPQQTLENRTAAYAVAQQVRLRLDRGLKDSRDDLIRAMQAAGMTELGPVSIKSSAVDPQYLVNEPENWVDDGVQDKLEELAAERSLRPYIRAIPRHLEINVDRMVEDIRLGVQAALYLFQTLNEKHWRVERKRRNALVVREAKVPSAA